MKSRLLTWFGLLAGIAMLATQAWDRGFKPRTIQQELLGEVVTGWQIPEYRVSGGFPPWQYDWRYRLTPEICAKLRAKFGCRTTGPRTFTAIRCRERAYPDWCFIGPQKQKRWKYSLMLITGGHLVVEQGPIDGGR
jgi:hypothetical protein